MIGKTRQWMLDRRCGVKSAYPNLGTARSAARALSVRYNEHFTAYQCRLCPNHHVGRERGGRRQPYHRERFVYDVA